MTEPTSGLPGSADYATRIDRVATWISDHLDHELDLHRLADIACFSPSHFHRIYRGMQGETVAETVRRLRLHRAAGDLIAGRLNIERVAGRAGYGSQEAFTRAFRAAYGVPPARYRASFHPANGDHPMNATTPYDVSIRTEPAIRVATLPHQGSYLEIGRTFQRLGALVGAAGLVAPGARMYGIYYDDPHATPVDQLRSDAGTSAPAEWNSTGELQAKTIRGGRYAIIEHVGPYAELHLAYDWLFGTWLPASGEEPADAPCVECYLNDPRTLPPTAWRTEIWLPLR